MCMTGDSNQQNYTSRDPSYHYATQSLMTSDQVLFIYNKFLKFEIKLLDAKTILNKNIVNCKVLDLVKHNNFDVDLFSM
jgi:hypothetical protein